MHQYHNIHISSRANRYTPASTVCHPLKIHAEKDIIFIIIAYLPPPTALYKVAGTCYHITWYEKASKLESYLQMNSQILWISNSCETARALTNV